MEIENFTRNQHYISQVEQRLNSINQNSKKPKIYEFEIIDREKYFLNLKNPKGRLIESNLCFDDLFSFDVLDKKIRANFEDLFSDYESNIHRDTVSLLCKLESGNEDVSNELINLYASKLLNFFRNPYSIEKVLNTLGDITLYSPTDLDLLKIFKRIEGGNKPQKIHMCSKLGVSEQSYSKWLKALFMLLVKDHRTNLNILESSIKSTFESKSLFINIFLFSYSGEYLHLRPLLSDRGFTVQTESKNDFSMSFNLNSNAFINYSIVDLDAQNKIPINKRTLKALKSQEKRIYFRRFENNLPALAVYNKNSIYQAKESVYCSVSNIYGI